MLMEGGQLKIRSFQIQIQSLGIQIFHGQWVNQSLDGFQDVSPAASYTTTVQEIERDRRRVQESSAENNGPFSRSPHQHSDFNPQFCIRSHW